METPSENPKRRPHRILILVPQIDDSGPVKGALALMTGLQNLGVHAICLPMAKSEVDQTTRDYVMCIAEASGWFQKIKALRKFVAKEAVLNKVSIISFCFRPDLLSVASGMRHISISSLRGSLTVNYQMQYGILGKWLAILHYTLALLHTRTVVLNQSMFKALEPFSKRLEKIENFINEQPIDRKRNECSNTVFIFVGSLTKRKGVLELIDAFSDVQRRGKIQATDFGRRTRTGKNCIPYPEAWLVESVSLLGQIKNHSTILRGRLLRFTVSFRRDVASSNGGIICGSSMHHA